MDTIPKIVLENPYRILGVYANSPRRDIIANKGRATAFLKVNRPVEFPLDLKVILPQLTRSLDSMNEAEAHLAIVKEQIKHAQFWFLKMTPLDDVAFNHLIAGKMVEAKNFWSRQESLSSLQNQLVCYLIEKKFYTALRTAEALYKKYGDTYINKVDANSTLQMTGTELLHLFIDSLGTEVEMHKLLGYELGEETKAYICSQTIGPLISKISSEVEKSKKVDHKDPDARKEAGQKLIVATKEPLQQLKDILSISDSQYSMIADKLGMEILQCGIDYFIGAKDKDDDAPFTSMKILKYADTIVAGSIAKERCKDQIKQLQIYIDNLPPKEAIAEDKAIKAALGKFVKLPDKISHAVTLLNETAPHLQSIKKKLGYSNVYYLKISTQIVGNALHNVVEEVNAVQQGNVIELDNGLSFDLDTLMSPEDRRAKYNRIKSTVHEAWNATTLMDEFDMEAGFKSHYNENRNTLKSMCNQMGISTYVSRPLPPPNPGPTPTPPPEPKKPNGCIIAIIVYIIASVVIGGIIAANGGDFAVGFIIAGIIALIILRGIL